MAEKDLDEIKDKLYDCEEPVDAELWTDIQDSLRRKRIRRVFYRAASCAAVIAAIFFLLTSVDIKKVRELEYFAQMFTSLPVPSHVADNSTTCIGKVVQSEERIFQDNQVYQIGQVHANQGAYTNQETYTAKKTGKIISAAETSAAGLPQDVVAVQEESAGKIQTGGNKENVCKETSAVGKAAEESPVREKTYNDDWFDLSQEDDVTEKRYALAFTGGFMPGSSASVTGSRIMAVSSADGVHDGYMVEQVSDTKYSLPVNLGVQLQFPVGENLALGVGVSYTRLKSKFDCLVNKVRYSGEQTLHYVGIPVNVYGTVAQRNRFTFYINGGAMIEKGIRAKYKFNS